MASANALCRFYTATSAPKAGVTQLSYGPTLGPDRALTELRASRG
jgi:hypothetical protein